MESWDLYNAHLGGAGYSFGAPEAPASGRNTRLLIVKTPERKLPLRSGEPRRRGVTGSNFEMKHKRRRMPGTYNGFLKSWEWSRKLGECSSELQVEVSSLQSLTSHPIVTILTPPPQHGAPGGTQRENAEVIIVDEPSEPHSVRDKRPRPEGEACPPTADLLSPPTPR